jgi:hypothetical protein
MTGVAATVEQGSFASVMASSKASDDALSFAIESAVAPGEDNELAVCQILVGRLRADGEEWGAPKKLKQDDDADCEAKGPSGLLRIQVTVPRLRREFFESLGKTGSAQATLSAEQWAATLHDAIRDKADTYARRDSLVLAVDGHQFEIVSWPEVVAAYRKGFGDPAVFGFRAIWVVGPTIESCKRLD